MEEIIHRCTFCTAYDIVLWVIEMDEIILASASPRRKEILTLMGLSFSIEPDDADEIMPSGEVLPTEKVKYLARQKALHIATKHPEAVVIGADTIVVLDGRILGKPHSQTEASIMLSALSGREHDVYTGVCVIRGDTVICESECTRVSFMPLTADMIRAYIATGAPMDKAGAYGIQGFGGMFVEKIHGCYFNVMGLPMHRLFLMLKQTGIVLF